MQIIGYAALSFNLVSMSMKNVLYLRVCSLVANAIYIVYGIMLEAPPVFIGCGIEVLLHSYWIYRTINQNKERK